MLTVIIPAQNEAPRLNWTIGNVYDTCSIEPEVIVIDNGGNGEIDPRAKIIRPDANVGERVAMNMAVAEATGEFILRIDAHCDFSPCGWDVMMTGVTGPKDVTVAVLTATTGQWEHTPQSVKVKWLKGGKTAEDWVPWQRQPGHWYGFCKLVVNEQGGLEAKWQKPNRDHSVYAALEPNMGLTGCGFMMRKSFYNEMGGADVDLPKMGAIGEEFAIKAWYYGGKVQTRTDVMIGHIFGTGGYDTSGVLQAQQELYKRYGACLDSVIAKFPDWNTIKLVRADQPGRPIRTVTVNREDKTNTIDSESGEVIRTKTETFRYVWLDNEHPDERAWTDKQIETKYAPLAVPVGEEITYPDTKQESMAEAK